MALQGFAAASPFPSLPQGPNANMDAWARVLDEADDDTARLILSIQTQELKSFIQTNDDFDVARQSYATELAE